MLLRYIAAAAAAGLLSSIASVALLPGFWGAALASGQGLLWCAAMLVRHRSRWLANVVCFGLCAGLAELATDAWLVHGLRSLKYPVGPALLASPAYMPVAWLGMLSAGLALGVLLRNRISLAASSALVALALGLYIPVYEALAARAGWWTYAEGPAAFGAVPVYIVVGEILLSLPLVAIAERLTKVSLGGAAALGVAQGAWIFASYWIASGACGAAPR